MVQFVLFSTLIDNYGPGVNFNDVLLYIAIVTRQAVSASLNVNVTHIDRSSLVPSVTLSRQWHV